MKIDCLNKRAKMTQEESIKTNYKNLDALNKRAKNSKLTQSDKSMEYFCDRAFSTEGIERANRAIDQWENESAVELWNAFVEMTEALSGFEDAGCDIGRCYKALSTIMNTKEPVNRRLIAEWLEAGRFEYKGLNDIKYE